MVATKCLVNKLQKDERFNSFILKKQTSPKCKNLDLSSYLLKPMQRITRYSLLFKQILHYTPKDHFERADILAALEVSEKLAQSVNQATKESESRQKIEDISAIVDLQLKDQNTTLDLSAPTRLLGNRLYIHEGPLAKNKSGRKIYCYLFNDLILLVEPKSKPSNIISVKACQYEMYEQPIPVNEMIIRDVPKNFGKDVGTVDDCSFQIVHLDKIITLRASTPSEKRQWIKVTEGAISDAEKRLASSFSDDKLHKESNIPIIGTLEVKLLEAKQLSAADRFKLKPGLFCVFNIATQTIRSKTSQSWPPKWEHDLVFSIFSLDSTLKISLYNYDRYSKDEYIGETSIQLDFLEYYGTKATEPITLKLKEDSGSVILQLAFRGL